ncbi:MAG: nucleotidyltransferase family protein [Nocardioides sp.]
MTPVGLLLAAGAGSRMGTPKALVRENDGTSWLQRSVAVLRSGGCAEVCVVLGAQAARARSLVPDGVDIVVATDWAEGMSASLSAGLDSLETSEHDAALVTLVDLPDLTADVVRRLLTAGCGPAALARATYAGRPGHPVLIGRDHWAGVLGSVAGDEGARAYLLAHGADPVECGDLATGDDQDTP